MSSVALLWAVVIGSLLLMFVIALALRVLRKREARRSPLSGKRIGHIPGQQLIERANESMDNVALGMLLIFLAGPMTLMCWAVLRLPPERLRYERSDWVLLLFFVGMVFWSLRSVIKHLDGARNARDGLLAERVTGMQLNRLFEKSCIVMHDIPADGFNLDHVVIAPGGVYAIETKSFRKPRHDAEPGKPATVRWAGESLVFPDFQTKLPIEQARRQAQWLANFLREAVATDVAVRPCVALPGWFIDKSDAGKKSDVFVFTPMGRGCEYFSYGEGVLAPEQRALIAKALALRYPLIDN